jgi:hypothetical protein
MRGDNLPRPACVARDEGIPCSKEKGRALPLEANFGMDMTQSVSSIAEDIYRQVADPHGLDPLYARGDVFVVLFRSSPASAEVVTRQFPVSGTVMTSSR